jgi:hypothetical protein
MRVIRPGSIRISSPMSGTTGPTSVCSVSVTAAASDVGLDTHNQLVVPLPGDAVAMIELGRRPSCSGRVRVRLVGGGRWIVRFRIRDRHRR